MGQWGRIGWGVMCSMRGLQVRCKCLFIFTCMQYAVHDCIMVKGHVRGYTKWAAATPRARAKDNQVTQT